jgi:hypothetical protein
MIYIEETGDFSTSGWLTGGYLVLCSTVFDPFFWSEIPRPETPGKTTTTTKAKAPIAMQVRSLQSGRPGRSGWSGCRFRRIHQPSSAIGKNLPEVLTRSLKRWNMSRGIFHLAVIPFKGMHLVRLKRETWSSLAAGWRHFTMHNFAQLRARSW